MKQKKLRSASGQQTKAHGENLGKRLAGGLICLYGPLGAGKTTFVQGLAKGLGISGRVTSPTFTCQRIHQGRVKLYHFDCYRLEKPDPLFLEEFREILGRGDGVIAVEWAEKIKQFLPEKRMEISMAYGDEEGQRFIIIKTA